MPTLDKETFSYWVTHPDDLTPNDLTQLKESLQAFPYCQSLHTLTAKASAIHQRGQAVSYIRQAAAHALSRNALRKLIENEFQWSDNLLSKLNELSDKHVYIPDDYQQESYAHFKRQSGLNNGFPKLSLLQLPPETAPTIPLPEDPTLAETNLQSDLELIAETPAETTSDEFLERHRQTQLIEDFIRNSPSIARPVQQMRAKPGEPTEPLEDLSKRSGALGNVLATESFAKILAKQGKTGKAREMYKQLMMKYPEKTAYFAAKISELERPATNE